MSLLQPGLDIHGSLGAGTTRLRMLSRESITYITQLVICRVSPRWALRSRSRYELVCAGASWLSLRLNLPSFLSLHSVHTHSLLNTSRRLTVSCQLPQQNTTPFKILVAMSRSVTISLPSSHIGAIPASLFLLCLQWSSIGL
jgi:hypothetical protein